MEWRLATRVRKDIDDKGYLNTLELRLEASLLAQGQKMGLCHHAEVLRQQDAAQAEPKSASPIEGLD